MPVEDHEVHEKTVQKAGYKYKCNSRKEYSKGYYAPDRIYKPDGTFYIVQSFIPHVMSMNCRSFYLWDTDPACTDCATKKDIEYANRMKGL